MSFYKIPQNYAPGFVPQRNTINNAAAAAAGAGGRGTGEGA